MNHDPHTWWPPHMRPSRLRISKPWALGLGVVFASGVAVVLLLLLTLSTHHRYFDDSHFQRLVLVNGAVALVLLLLTGILLSRLVSRWRQQRFGSRLLVKLAAIFGLVGLLPGVLIYTVSYQFVSRSIETWFDVRVESALSAGLNLGRTALDALSADLAAKTRAAANSLATSSSAGTGLAVERLRDQLVASDVVLWNEQGQALASAGESRFALTPERPSAAQLRQVRNGKVWASIEGLEEESGLATAAPEVDRSAMAAAVPRIRVLALVAAPNFQFGGGSRYLQVTAPLPAALVADALAVQQAYREYQERALGREGLRRMYIGTLTLTLFLAVFGAVLLAVLLGNQLMHPLLVLAEGMRDVARGDLTPKLALSAKDELAGLTRTFAHMTQELADARHAVQHSMAQVDGARANLQTILDNLTAGVVALDEQMRLLSANPGAARVLRTPLEVHLGHSLHTVPGAEEFARWVQQQFEAFLADQNHHDDDHWQQAFEWHEVPGTTSGHGPEPRAVTLMVRGALLPNHERLLVLDDVSDMISAQRAQAWGEVARRLAHEIKNPLTPIQLSAERLAMKLDDKLQLPERALLHKSVKTIVDQVDAMKRLVNEFRDYARLPAAQLAPLNLNALLKDIVPLYDAATVPVQLELDPACPAVQADAQQIRQVIHNLVQNAQDATPAGAGPVLLQTRTSDDGQRVRLLVLDCGPGFADHILKRAFEPYVTTKAKGTGLGLAVVKKIMDEHGGRIEITHRRDGERVLGAQVSLSFRVANSQHNNSEP